MDNNTIQIRKSCAQEKGREYEIKIHKIMKNKLQTN